MKRKLSLIFLSLVCAVCCSFGLTACGETHSHTFSDDWSKNETHHWHAATCEHTEEKSNYAEHDFSQSDTCVCGYKRITANGLLTEYKAQTESFLTNKVLPKALDGEDTASVGYSIITDDNNCVTGADIIAINIQSNVFGDLAEGKVLLLNVTFSSPVSAASIADGTASAVNLQTNKTTVFEFDAKENFDNQDIINALYNAKKVSSSELKLISDFEAEEYGYKGFNYLVINGTEIKVAKTEVELGNGSNENIINNFKKGNTTNSGTVATYSMQGTYLKTVSYACDNIKLTHKFDYKKTAEGYALTGMRDKTVTELEIPQGITSIVSGAFDGCDALESISVAEDNASFSSRDGILYNKEKTEFLHIPAALKGTVTIPDGITRIGYEAFSERAGLTGITFPEGLTEIGYQAFKGCTGIKEITFPGDINPLNIIGLQEGTTFSDCPVEKATLPSSMVKYIKKTNLKTAVITSGESIRGFAGCDLLTSVTLPESITYIGSYAFSNCPELTDINIPDGVTSIDEGTFYGCSSLKNAPISNMVSIGKNAFYGCAGLTKINIPAGLTNIGEKAFGNCIGIEEITADSGNATYHAVNNCLISTAYKSLVLGCKNSVIPADGTVAGIAAYAFYYCGGLKSVSIPKTITGISPNAFNGCYGLESITVESGNAKYYSEGNCVIEVAEKYKTKMLVVGCKNSVIPADVVQINTYAFAGCESLTNISIPSGITFISYYAFDGCTGLEEVYISYRAVISEFAFSNCTGLRRVNIPYVTEIQSLAFEYCKSLTEIIAGTALSKIANDAFYRCSALNKITYNGKQAQWNAINKESGWDESLPQDYTVVCTDGIIKKN